MLDQIVIEQKGSLDFDASVAERSVSEPKRKSIKETVPFSNNVYDFTKINGEIYWEERTLTYIFEIIADSPEELEEKKRLFKNWIMLVHEEELHDPFIKGYHFIATCSDIQCNDSEIEKSTITVTFTAYPYMIADEKTVYSFDLVANEEMTVEIVNDSSHRISPTFINDTELNVTRDNTTYTVPTGETTDEVFVLKPGMNTLTLHVAESGKVQISFYAEVL